MRGLVVIAILAWAGTAHAGDGTLIVDVVKADGHAAAADCEVRVAGATAVLKKLGAGTGLAQTGLAAGSYDVACASRIGGLKGTLRVSVTGGKTSRFKVTLKSEAIAPPRLTGTVVDAAGKPVTGKVEIVLSVDVVGGAFDAGALPSGRYTVRYTGAGTQVAAETVTVTAGRPARVDLRLGSAGKVIAPKPIQ